MILITLLTFSGLFWKAKTEICENIKWNGYWIFWWILTSLRLKSWPGKNDTTIVWVVRNFYLSTWYLIMGSMLTLNKNSCIKKIKHIFGLEIRGRYIAVPQCNMNKWSRMPFNLLKMWSAIIGFAIKEDKTF